ncbi:MAG TPA: antibiotic biosynthesis monooxygenase family protein [Methylovirgula sp.]|nr:antibiotic biosynthesis monooxygenase family protein [Methylovirgula sp.]
MIEFRELDEIVSIRDQLQEDSDEPVVLINLFHVPPGGADELVKAWEDDARYFKGQPGFISTQLHRGTSGSGTFLNYAIWETVGAFRTAFSNPAFQSKLAAYPEGTIASPHLFRKLAVDGICVG